MSQIAADSSSHRIGLRESARVDRVVARKEAGVTEVDSHLDHISQRCPVRFQNGCNIVDGLLRLLLDVVSDELSC
jgi:hypothetical protein